MAKPLITGDNEVVVAFRAWPDGGGEVIVSGDPFSDTPRLPVTILVGPYSTAREVMQLIGNVVVAYGYLSPR